MAENDEKKEENTEAGAAPAAPAKAPPKVRIIVGILIAVVLSGALGTFFIIKTLKSRADAEANAQNTTALEQGGGTMAPPPGAPAPATNPADASATPVADPKKGTTPSFGDIYRVPKIDINLGNPIDARFLRISLALEYQGGDTQGLELKNREVQLTDIVITTASTRTRAELLTDIGKENLRRDLLNRFNEVLDRPILNIFFTEFLVE
jgi:flagellar basal body-associated protein FliL